jgi:hypothetical protein
MENNKTPLSYPEAYKVYMGRSFPNMVAQLSLFAVGMFLCFKLVLTFLDVIEGDDINNDTDQLVNDFISTIFCGIIVALRMSSTFTKSIPGGKFFRTVKGGFDTFKKAHYTMAAEGITVIIIFSIVIGIFDAVGFAPLRFGTASCVSICIFVTLARAVSSIFAAMKNTIMRLLVSMIVNYIISAMGIVSLILTDGKLCAFHIAAAAAAVVLTVVSEIAVVTSYRKKHWDN